MQTHTVLHTLESGLATEPLSLAIQNITLENMLLKSASSSVRRSF
jgi:hypothetical protein